jgi:hypothetical protein
MVQRREAIPIPPKRIVERDQLFGFQRPEVIAARFLDDPASGAGARADGISARRLSGLREPGADHPTRGVADMQALPQ